MPLQVDMTGQEFAQHRKRLGWSQEKLVEIYGRSRRQVINWEHEKTPIPKDSILLTKLLVRLQGNELIQEIGF